MDPLEIPDVAAMEAALTHWISRTPDEDEDQLRSCLWFLDAIKQSPSLEEALEGLLENQLDLRTQKEMLVQRLGDGALELTDAQIRKYSLMSAACQFFFIGWNARGAVEDAERLKGMAE
jgi:hypothetical protein